MSKNIDILAVYQENGLPHEKVIAVPGGLSNNEFLDFIRTDLGDGANIINLMNLGVINSQKSLVSDGLPAAPKARPERASDRRNDNRSRFSEGSRPYSSRGGFEGGRSSFGSDRGGFGAAPRGRSEGRSERSSGGYAGRSPRDGAKPGRGGFGARPSRGESRDAGGAARGRTSGGRAGAGRGR